MDALVKFSVKVTNYGYNFFSVESLALIRCVCATREIHFGAKKLGARAVLRARDDPDFCNAAAAPAETAVRRPL
jgi:hypothetical protein